MRVCAILTRASKGLDGSSVGTDTSYACERRNVSRPSLIEIKGSITAKLLGCLRCHELEIFLFNLEQCFRATQPKLEDSKVSLAMIYLVGDAKLWWRTRWEDMQQSYCNIDTCKALKRELQTQLMPENT